MGLGVGQAGQGALPDRLVESAETALDAPAHRQQAQSLGAGGGQQRLLCGLVSAEYRQSLALELPENRDAARLVLGGVGQAGDQLLSDHKRLLRLALG